MNSQSVDSTERRMIENFETNMLGAVLRDFCCDSHVTKKSFECKDVHFEYCKEASGDCY